MANKKPPVETVYSYDIAFDDPRSPFSKEGREREAKGGARPGAGRPALSALERKSRRIDVYVSEPDGKELDAWAKREGLPLSELLAERGLRAARRAK